MIFPSGNAALFHGFVLCRPSLQTCRTLAYTSAIFLCAHAQGLYIQLLTHSAQKGVQMCPVVPCETKSEHEGTQIWPNVLRRILYICDLETRVDGMKSIVGANSRSIYGPAIFRVVLGDSWRWEKRSGRHFSVDVVAQLVFFYLWAFSAYKYLPFNSHLPSPSMYRQLPLYAYWYGIQGYIYWL